MTPTSPDGAPRAKPTGSAGPSPSGEETEARGGAAMVGALFGGLVALAAVTGGFAEPTFAPLYITPVLAGLLMGGRGTRRFAAAVVVAAVALFAAAHQGVELPNLIPESSRRSVDLVVRLGIAAAFAVMVPKLLAERDETGALLEEARAGAQEVAGEKAALLEAWRRTSADVTTMLEHVPQGIFTIVTGRRVQGATSTHLGAILGHDDVTDRTLDELLLDRAALGQDHRSAVTMAIDTALGSDRLTFDFNEHHLPRELTLERHGVPQELEVDWVPILSDHDVVDRLMITLRDVTGLRALQRTERQQREELAIVGELVHCDADTFGTTLSAGRETVRACKKLIAAGDSSDAVAQLFRLTHTLKGEARTQGWTRVADAAHQAESRYAALRDGDADWDAEALQGDLDALGAALDRYEDVWQVSLARAASGTTRRGGGVKLEALCRRPLLALGPSAADQGKTLPTLVVDDAGLALKHRWARGLQLALIHLLTNAVDHGIEADAARRKAGKSIPASIRMAVTRAGDEVALEVWDDGAGLDCDRLRGGADHDDDAALLETIFASGVSTQAEATETSGRGVGLDAARALVESQGGSLGAAFAGGERGDARRPITLRLVLPGAMWTDADADHDDEEKGEFDP